MPQKPEIFIEAIVFKEGFRDVFAQEIVKFLAVVVCDFVCDFSNSKQLIFEDCLEHFGTHFLVVQVAKFLKQHFANAFVVELAEIKT